MSEMKSCGIVGDCSGVLWTSRKSVGLLKWDPEHGFILCEACTGGV